MNRLPHSDLIGRRFGSLTALRTSHDPKFVTCLCDCGGERNVLSNELRRGKAKTCGQCDAGIRMVPGVRFGLWTIISPPMRFGKRFAFLCRCDCGAENIVLKSNLTVGESKSCGCDMRTKASDRSGKHRMCHTPEYHIWIAMRSRCNSSKHPHYSDYGGRGITVCERWNSFENFLSDMGPRPPHGEIERNDNEQGYRPDNCRWATRQEQCNNTRANHFITWRGETHTLSQWAAILGINPKTLSQRINGYRWTAERALSTPVR